MNQMIINRQPSQKNQEGQFQQQQPKNQFLESKFIYGPILMKQDLMCLICSCLLIDTSTCNSCGQSYCSHCIEQWLKEGSGCLKCEGFQFKKQKPHMYDDFMSHMKIDCPFSQNLEMNFSCTKKNMSLNEAMEHIQNCQFQIKKCLNQGCDFEGIQEQMYEHKLNCKFRLFQCIYCNLQMQHRYFQQHDLECPKKLILCQHCNASVFQIEMDNHTQTDCPEVQLTCNFCNHNYIRKIFNLHRDQCPQRPITCDCNQIFKLEQIQQHQQICQQIKLTCEKCNKIYIRAEEHQNKDCIKYLSQMCNQIETDVFLLNEQIKEIRYHLKLPLYEQQPQYHSFIRPNQQFYQQ